MGRGAGQAHTWAGHMRTHASTRTCRPSRAARPRLPRTPGRPWRSWAQGWACRAPGRVHQRGCSIPHQGGEREPSRGACTSCCSAPLTHQEDGDGPWNGQPPAAVQDANGHPPLSARAGHPLWAKSKHLRLAAASAASKGRAGIVMRASVCFAWVKHGQEAWAFTTQCHSQVVHRH